MDRSDYTSDRTADRFMAQHHDAPGPSRSCVSVTDDQGRVAYTCTNVQPGALQLER